MKYQNKGFTLIELMIVVAIIGILAAIFVPMIQGKTGNGYQPSAASGVTKAQVKVETGSDGLTIEQRNVKKRLEEDNKIGAIKHLYIISAYSGDVILYSTVDGKVTSGGKRLTPTSVSSGGDFPDSIPVTINGSTYYTPEVLQDDGTYGSSMNYLYWWDAKGAYHQHYVSGGQIPHISSEPLSVSKVIINIE